jgi:alpha-1,2-mannosyltransferase
MVPDKDLSLHQSSSDGRACDERVLWLSGFFIAFALPLIVWLVWSSDGVLTISGLPLGADFPAYWTAARLAVSGDAAGVYETDSFLRFQRETIGGHGIFPFQYMPTYLLLISPLGFLPYGIALLIFLTLTFLMAGYALQRLGSGDRRLWLVAAGTPAFLLVVLNGQNVFLTTALFAFALLALDSPHPRGPILAGGALALLTVRPQFGLLIPVALIVGGYWRAIGWGALWTALIVLASLIAFGVQSWEAFVAQSDLWVVMLTDGLVHRGKLISVYPSARLLGMDHGGALLFQGFVGLALLVLIARVWRIQREAARPMRNAVLIVASLLATPYAFDYDLFLALPAMLILYEAGGRNRLNPPEIAILAVLWLLPLVSRVIGMGWGLPVAPVVLGGFLALLVLRWRAVVTTD